MNKNTGIAAIIAAALILTGCATNPAPEPAPVAAVEPAPRPKTPVVYPFTTNGYQLNSDVRPYADRPIIDIHATETDGAGIAVYRDRFTKERHDHPVAYAQYGLQAILEYQATGDALWLDRAKANAQRLLDIHVERDGAWWYPYTFNWTYYDRTLTAPWWSGMAQGQVLSLFSQLTELEPSGPWAVAADRTWVSFAQYNNGDGQPWSTLTVDGSLWFEEYAGDQPPLLVLNGQIFAMFGLYDYYELTHDETVRAYFDGGAATVLSVMGLIREVGGPSFYCVQPESCRINQSWQNHGYHPVHIWQLRSLEAITGDARFGEWAAVLDSDFQL